MEMLDENEIELTVAACGEKLVERAMQASPHICGIKVYTSWCGVKHLCSPLATWECHGILTCNGPFIHSLHEGLKACGDAFYVKCPGFERIERYCDFEPAIDAAKWKDQVQVEKIAKLEARIQELELKISKAS